MGLGIIRNYRRFKHWYHSIVTHKEKSGIEAKIPFFTKFKYNLLGFTDFQYITFDLKNNDYREYISTKERNRLENVNGRFAFFLGEKVMFERVFGDFVHVPHIYCWVKKGKFINLDNNEEEISLLDVLQKEKELIAKPTRSVGGGSGIHQLSYDGNYYYTDGVQVSKEELIQKVREMEEYIVTHKVISHKYATEIYPHSTNSIRVVTVMDNDRNEADLLFCFHRFGTDRSMPVDNISSGGVFALIDNDTGVMSKARSLFELKKEFSKHPGTGAQIEGTKVPCWENIISQLKKAHKCFPYYNFFAWDVAIDENNIPYILEINRGSDLSIQMIKPMRNAELGKYMRSKGLLDKR